jgi:hypothetical protein
MCPDSVLTDLRILVYEALLVPSTAVAGSKNLVIFLDKASARPNVLVETPQLRREELKATEGMLDKFVVGAGCIPDCTGYAMQ